MKTCSGGVSTCRSTFLSSRFRKQKDLLNQFAHSFIQDRTIYEDVEIFARNLYDMGLMSHRDYENYRSLFKEMTDYLRPPDLLIYLRAKVPTLVNQIQLRGRDYENSIRIDYLEGFNKLYESLDYELSASETDYRDR
jgi:deoxyadenosine/deoxycytidine kinase